MPLDLPKPTELAIPLFVVLVLIEILYTWYSMGRGGRSRSRYEAKDTLTSLSMGLGSVTIGAIGTTSILTLSYWVWQNFAIFSIPMTPMTVLAALVLDDLAYYWVHRSGHRMRWMWASHINHHSSQHYNLSTALRQSWTGSFTPAFLFRMPLFLIGFEPALIAFVAGLNLIYQFWIHTEAIDRLPRWFEAIFNTPSHHRVHHAKNPDYLDANYAGIFIIWDKLFGTFTPEAREEPPIYGLVSDLATFNPLFVAFHEWRAMIHDVWHAPGPRHKLSYVFREPGWSHNGSRLTSEQIRKRWRASRAGASGKPPTSTEPGSNCAPSAHAAE